MIRINKKIYCLFYICIVFLLLLHADMAYAAKLKKGIYEIKNPKMGSSMYVDETGKVILKDEPKCTIGRINDLFTDETVLLTKYYGKLYEESEWDSEDNRKYDGLVDPHNEYYTIKGERLDYDKYVIGVVDNNVFFNDGSARNITFDTNFKLPGLSDNSSGDYTYSMIKFGDTLVINEVSKSASSTRNASFMKGEYISNYSEGLKIYFYDRRFNLLKTIDGYTSPQQDNVNTNKDNYLIVLKYNRVNDDILNTYNVIDKDFNLVFEHEAKSLLFQKDFLYVTFIADSDYNIIDYEGKIDEDQVVSKYYYFKDKKLKDIYDINKSYYNIRFKYDKEKLVSTIYDNKKVLIADTQINNCIAFLFGENKYYYIKTKNDKHYFYNDKGDRIKILNIYSNASCKIIYLDSDYIFLAASSQLYIYNKDLDLVNNISCTKAEQIRVVKVMNKEYYALKNSKEIAMLLDKNAKKVYESTDASFDIVKDKYLVQTQIKESKVFDDKLNQIYSFDEKITSAKTLKIKDKVFILTYFENGMYVFDDNMKFISKFDSSSLYGTALYGEDGINLKLKDDIPYIIIHSKKDDKNIIDIYDLNFKNLDSIELKKNPVYIEENDEYIDYIDINLVNGNMIVIGENLKNFSIYKIGLGYVLKDFYYLGNFEKDHFTYANGFYYGFMDYDMNILYQFSIFDKFDEDNMIDYYW